MKQSIKKDLRYDAIKIDNLIDPQLIQNFQNRFCRANDIYLTCLGVDAGVIGERFGTEEEISYIKELVSPAEMYALVRRAQENLVERIVEEDFSERHVKVCAVSTQFDGRIQIIWIVTAFLQDYMETPEDVPAFIKTTTEERLYNSIEFLELLSRYLFITKADELIATEAISKHVEAENELKNQLFRSRSMTEIVTMLESDEAFSRIVDEILQEVCNTIDVPRGFLLQRNRENDTINMICEFALELEQSQIEIFQGVLKEELPFFNGKNYVISADSMIPKNFSDLMEKFGAVAGVFQPITVNDEVEMYLCFLDISEEQIWDVDELKFINDAKRIIQTVLNKRIAKNSLASSYASLEAILENVGCGICVYDRAKQKLLYSNQQFNEIYGRSIASKQLDRVLFPTAIEEASFKEFYMPEEERWIDQQNAQIKWVDGSVVTLCTVYDISEKKRYQEKIEQQANNDFLTGLFNRMRCEADLGKQIELVKNSSEKGALLYIDLDDFKHINDGLGHQYGDVLLKTISRSLQKIKGVGSNCYRVGGDEFMVILSDSAYERIDEICTEIKDIFNRPWFLKGEDYYCTTSIGIVVFPDDGTEVEDLIRKADLAMFRAKRAGKNRVEFYAEVDDQEASRRLDIEKNMRKATVEASREFEVYYQPIINVTDPSDPCCGAEALIRWNSPELGFVSPADFIPMAEYLGLINPIGDYVLLEAAKRCKYWNDMGHPNYKVNVNLSVVQLLQNDIVKKISDVLKETRINPKNLTLEVTESLAINDMDRMKSILNQIKALGVKVALDDFGTGYSSLNHVREIPIDIIKIDRCFIENLEEDSFSDAFVQMVTTLARAIDVHVCVEGVENHGQCEHLKSLGVDMIQGYFFGRPMRVNEFEQKYVL